MKIAYQQQHATQIDNILSALPKNASTPLVRFVEQFYGKMPVADLEAMNPKNAVALAKSAFEFMQKRKMGSPKIRIITPEDKVKGYDSHHTVVQLLNDDIPFLIDSLSAELTRHGFTLYETLHPIFPIKRKKNGEFESLGSDKGTKAGEVVESFIHFEISALPEGLTVNQLINDLEWVLAHIREAVADWKPIVAKAKGNIKQLHKLETRFSDGDIKEVEDFLGWLVDKNFVFLGYAEYDFLGPKGEEELVVVEGSRLGILKITDELNTRGMEMLSSEARQFLMMPQLIEITKSNRRSPVHRSVPMDYIALKRFDSKGNVVGEARFLGLFTSNVYYQSTDDIPFVRQKAQRALERSGYAEASHDGKAFKTILEFLPRDEILQMSEDELFETSMGILSLESKPGVRVFARKDTFERFVSAMIFVPREQFSTELRKQIQKIIETAYGGTSSAFSTQITEAPLARLHLMIKTAPGDIPQANLKKIEDEIAKRAYLWGDLLLEGLVIKHGEQRAEKLQRIYGNAFSQSYINRHDAMSAVHDIDKVEEALEINDLTLALYQNKGQDSNLLHLKIYNPNEQIALSDILPMLENAGFRVIEEQPYHVTLADGTIVWLRDFKLQLQGALKLSVAKLKPLLEEVLLKVWFERMESDRFNALVLYAGFTWREIVCMRALAKYLKQAKFAQGQATIEQTMLNHPEIARSLADLFAARFDPKTKGHDAKEKKARAAIEHQLSNVSSAVEDRILRRYMDLMCAIMRTNYYQPDPNEDSRPVLAFKFRSSNIPELPKPHPFAEIFVYSPRVEGIHLRGGKVARGGLRWSDRHEDFRTEVLGLMKAQMVKNSVIVPVGSKGGFVVKRQTSTREEFMEEGVSCYKMYLSGLLDVTDNIVKGKIVPPVDVVRHDEDDPYLVVAADKGTATFSDIANGISAEYGFWLGDAFASGGSVGYDHKKMGITARGAWVSVIRHFAEMGVDIAEEEFTVAGIGDMGGDVFGNGMLLSDNIRLVAAFNHMHIFIDPNPDAKKSYAERKRMFALPRSSWLDYKKSLISKGGGVYSRSEKTIEISREAQNALGVHRSKFTPDELIRAILLSPVDLLWNGGIGTYVKSEDETHAQVGDRNNNAVRVNGKDLSCKIVGEGGNLGFTQKGRIEYAQNGGRINTDAIDNSAGVDCSDHEVNIKIAFSPLLASKKLSQSKRDTTLEKMTKEVASLVLKDNVLQTQAITIAEKQGVDLLDAQQRFMHKLERKNLLNRAIEFLPTDKQIDALRTARKGLTRPEISVLLAYSKMELYTLLLESSLPDEPYFVSDLKRYFPKAMQANFEQAIEDHRLRREIIATVMTNSIVNRAGITFYYELNADTESSSRDVAAAYAIARDAFDLRTIWNDIEALPASVPLNIQVMMHAEANRFLKQASLWMLRNLPKPLDIDAAIADIMPGIADIEKHKTKLHSDTMRKEADALLADLKETGVPAKLAKRIANLELLASALDIIKVARELKKPVEEIGSHYFEISALFNIFWLRLSAEKIEVESHWDRHAIQALDASLSDEQRRLTTSVIKSGDFEKWQKKHAKDIEAYGQFIADLRTSDTFDVSRLMVALQQVRSLG
ncbi:MAG: NAD-glutamate dehydrogenase [Rickettsiales bacterium]